MAPTANFSRVSTRSGAVVWSDDFLSHQLSVEHPMNPRRLSLTMQLARSIGLLEGIELVGTATASESDLLRIHAAAYIQAVKRAPHLDAAGRKYDCATHGLGTEDNPVFERMHESSAMIVGGSLTAARMIAAGHTQRAVSIGGGMHHALTNSASGFCIYNDCAIAIAWLLANGYERIAYIDVDAHHGDGVQKAFFGDPRVLTVSIHQHPATLWPNTGWAAETGYGAAEGTAVNLSVLPGTQDAVWHRAFSAVVPSVIGAFKPQIIISQCGVDSHREDLLADLELSIDGQRAAFMAMRDLADKYCGGRWLAVGGGGYGLYRVVPRAWTHLIAAVLDRDIDPDTPVPDSWREHVHSLFAPGSSIILPQSMSDGAPVKYWPWGGPGAGVNTGSEKLDRDIIRVDSAIEDTRRAIFPLYGLDPEDPRD
ncbi:MAG: acetoin utilization protein AcuC [Mycobacteriaceae bacterium]